MKAWDGREGQRKREGEGKGRGEGGTKGVREREREGENKKNDVNNSNRKYILRVEEVRLR